MNLQIERDSVVVLQGVFVEGDGARRALKVRIGDGNRLLLGRIDDFEFEQLVDPGDVDRSFSRRQGVVEADSNVVFIHLVDQRSHDGAGRREMDFGNRFLFERLVIGASERSFQVVEADEAGPLGVCWS